MKLHPLIRIAAKAPPVTAVAVTLGVLANLIAWGMIESLKAEAWAAWVQAVGSIVAIMLSYFLFQRQRRHEIKRGQDEELLRRTRAVQALQDVAYHAIEVMEHCIEVRECHFQPGVMSDLRPRLDELRSMFDRFVDPTSERHVVVAALMFGNALAETKSDAHNFEPALEDYVVQRMIDRRDKMSRAYDQLIRQMLALQDECNKKGLSWEPDCAFPPSAG